MTGTADETGATSESTDPQSTDAVLRASGLHPEAVRALMRSALDEDLRYGPDATTEATVPLGPSAEAAFNARQPGVLAGIPLMRAAFEEGLGAGRFEVLFERADGATLERGDCAMRVRAPARGLLTAERTALNLLCHLSGIATLTASWVSVVAGTRCRIRDSRKTLPGLRVLQKYAVRCGGGVNQRFGLGDAMLIKDNHVVAAGSVVEALRACRAHAPELPLEVEVSTVDELEDVLAEGAELVLLDNFTPEQCAVAFRSKAALAPGTELESSGGLALENARAYAETGVDYVAVGELTHSVRALDLGLDMEA